MRESAGDRTKSLPLRRRIVIEMAERFHRLASDPIGELYRVRRRAERRGVRMLDFTSPRSDYPLPAATEPSDALEKQIAGRLAGRWGVSLDPATEILAVPHIDELIRLFALAFIDNGDVVLLPDPADPIYRSATVLAGGWPVTVPLFPSRGFLPDLDRIEPEAAHRARVLFADSPAYPTGAVAPAHHLDDLVAFAKKHNVIVAHDATGASALLEGERPASLLERRGGRDVGVEFHAFAPLHDTGGKRPGFVAGNREIVGAIKTLQAHLGNPVTEEDEQLGYRAFLAGEGASGAAEHFRTRRDCAIRGLANIGWQIEPPRVGISLWIPVPDRLHSMRFSSMLLRKAGIAVVPGVLFGEFGHDSVLISLTRDETEIEIALDRLRTLANNKKWRIGGGAKAAQGHAAGGEIS